MKRTIHDTYCNPIVLPDYPNLQSLRETSAELTPEEMMANRPDPWGRKGKTVYSESIFHGETTQTNNMMSAIFAPGYGCQSENDIRATADPSPYFFEGKWYLYPTCGVIYSSDDLVNWTPHHEPTWMPISAPMAPTVEECRGKYYATANGVPLHVADSPIGPWTRLGEWTLEDGREFSCADPMIFADDDGRLYLYFGLGSAIFGAELDPAQPNRVITFPKKLIAFNGRYPWERYGSSNEDWSMGFVEGSWMVKNGNTYYLLYSCSGTEYYSYAMGCYVCDSPLGDFKLQPNNPVSCSREGLIKGGGHGGVVKGPKDTLWIFYTIPVYIDSAMERRIAMDPAGFDKDGNFFSQTGCAVPQWKPGVLERPELGNATELVPLTIFKPTKVSSYKDGHRSLNAIDEALHTWWQPAPGDEAPELAVAFMGRYIASAVRILWKDIGLHFEKGVHPGAYQYVVEVARDNQTEEWITVVDASTNTVDLAVDYRTFDPVDCTRARIRILGAPKGVTPGLLNFTVFGESASKPNRQF
ncbi:MAG: family 43 glycosylhydrolase [Oscillospiraceae bacterium]|nr:family 43 glycosylhydrolase [Oscillospiraceae bacterium]